MCIGLGVVVGRSEDEWAHRKAGAGPQQEGEAGKRTGCHLTGVWNHHGETPLYPELQMENKYEKYGLICEVIVLPAHKVHGWDGTGAGGLMQPESQNSRGEDCMHV